MADLLSGRVFLAFDDFSRAGKHALHFAKIDGVRPVTESQATVDTLLSAECGQFVQIYGHPDGQTALIVVNSAEMTATQRWEVADALVSAISRANVQTLTIVAALHLPYAKDGGLNVFYSGLNADSVADEQVDVAALAAADPAWEVKDPWLAALLHLLKAEQWPRTHLLLTKGYKPGRDLAATYEAVDALSQALQLFTKDKVAVDVLEVQRELPRLLAKDKTGSATDDNLTLLYQ